MKIVEQLLLIIITFIIMGEVCGAIFAVPSTMKMATYIRL